MYETNGDNADCEVLCPAQQFSRSFSKRKYVHLAREEQDLDAVWFGDGHHGRRIRDPGLRFGQASVPFENGLHRFLESELALDSQISLASVRLCLALAFF